MSRSLQTLAVLALLAGVAACQDSGSTTGTSSDLLVADGFETLPLGFADVNSTFGSVSDSGTTGWHPRGPRGRGHRGQGGMMCGGLGGFFGPGLDFGLRHGPFRGQLGATCSFDAGINRVVCDTVTRGGLSIAQSIAYYDTAGVVQSAYDSLSTNTINVQVSVTGTKVHHGGDTSVVRHASDRTVTGLAPGSTARQIDGTSRGSETTTGSDTLGTFTAVRTLGDTLQGVVVPAAWGPGVYPTAGTIIRAMDVTVTYEGQAPASRSRREVLTFDGTSTATLVITQNGVTTNCTIQLPHGRPSCS